MLFPHDAARIALFSLVSFTQAPPPTPARCQSFGVDFQNGGSYCINSALNENFTFVSEFEGCTMAGPNTFADTLLVLPHNLRNGDIIRCSDVVDTSPDTKQLSTCPIKKSDLVSGDYVLILAGNNGDGSPYAYFRNFTLHVGPQATATTTHTVTHTVTSTPYTRITSKIYTTTTDTLNATATIYAPEATALCPIIVRPNPVTRVIPQTLTWHRNEYSVSEALDFVYVAPSCVYPSPWPDPTFAYWPYVKSGLRDSWNGYPEAGERQTPAPIWSKYIQQAQEQSRNADRYLHQIKKRAPDACGVRVTAPSPVFVTSTVIAPTFTETESRTTTSTISTHLRPSTVRYVTTIGTVTAEPATVTRLEFLYETKISTSTLTVTRTQAYTITPPGAVASCRAMGGYLVGQGGW